MKKDFLILAGIGAGIYFLSRKTQAVNGIEKHLDNKSHNVKINIGATPKQFSKFLKAQKKQIEVSKKISEKFINWEFPVPPVNTLYWNFNDWSNWILKYGKEKKSKEAKKVLQLMDEDYTYQQALKIVLNENQNINKKNLEKELNKYI